MAQLLHRCLDVFKASGSNGGVDEGRFVPCALLFSSGGLVCGGCAAWLVASVKISGLWEFGFLY